MRVHVVVEVEGVDPTSYHATCIVDRIEASVRKGGLDSLNHYWWINVEGGETRYAPDADCDPITGVEYGTLS